MIYNIGNIVKVKAYYLYYTTLPRELVISKGGEKTSYDMLVNVKIIGVNRDCKEYLVDATGHGFCYPTIKEYNSIDIFNHFSLHPKNYHNDMVICKIFESGILFLA